MKSTVLTIRISPDEKRIIEAAAKRARRTMSEYVIIAALSAVEQELQANPVKQQPRP